MTKRWQKNITISDEQAEYIKANKKNMSISELSKMLGLTPNKVHNNLRVMGLVKSHKTKVVKMEGYFDVDEFQKLMVVMRMSQWFVKCLDVMLI